MSNKIELCTRCAVEIPPTEFIAFRVNDKRVCTNCYKTVNEEAARMAQAGCSAHECHIVGKNTGQCTNSTCNCLSPLSTSNSLALRKRIAFLERALKSACSDLNGLDNRGIYPEQYNCSAECNIQADIGCVQCLVNDYLKKAGEVK